MQNKNVKYYEVGEINLPLNFSNQNFFNQTNVVSSPQGVPQKTINKFLAEIDQCNNQDRFKRIEKNIQKLANEKSHSHIPLQLFGALYQKVGLLEKAVENFKAAYEMNEEISDTASNLATCYYQLKNFQDAEYYFQLAITKKPDNQKYHLKLAYNYLMQNNSVKAYDHFKYALKLNPKYTDALCGLGELLSKELKIVESSKCFELALRIDPNNFPALNRLSIQYTSLMKIDEALELNARAEKIKPGFVGNKINRANIYIKSGELDKALYIYSNLDPATTEQYDLVLFGMATIENKKGNISKALEFIERSIDLQPENTSYLNFKGVCFDLMRRTEDAKECYKKALKFEEKNISAITNLANLLANEGNLEEALELYSNAFRFEPTNQLAGTNAFNTARKLCDWPKASVLSNKIKNNGLEKLFVQPWIYLQLEDNPATQMLRSITFSKENYAHIEQRPKSSKNMNEDRKLKIGYFSADFHNHATYYLISGLLRQHDKGKFEIHLFSYGNEKNSDVYNELQSYGHHIHDVQSKTNEEILQLTDSISIDIAVDLKGFTKDNRCDLFAYRIAPVQVAYLGYPSTMGADFIDYMIADKTVIPPTLREYYTEKIIYMPHCYQPNDNKRRIGSESTTRETWGLPEDAYVLCCFNQNFKITKDEIDIWAAVLQKNQHAVMWLLKGHETANRNLKAAFRKRGIKASRVIFAPYAPQEAHLERLKHADLFLDTFFVNAHTSASDALWAGVPVITKCGKQFAARVAASLLGAIGMKKLVANDNKSYEALILYYIENRNHLDCLKEELRINLKTQPLYDTKGYTKDFEAGLKQIFKAHQQEEILKDVWVGK